MAPSGSTTRTWGTRSIQPRCGGCSRTWSPRDQRAARLWWVSEPIAPATPTTTWPHRVHEAPKPSRIPQQPGHFAATSLRNAVQPPPATSSTLRLPLAAGAENSAQGRLVSPGLDAVGRAGPCCPPSRSGRPTVTMDPRPQPSGVWRRATGRSSPYSRRPAPQRPSVRRGSLLPTGITTPGDAPRAVPPALRDADRLTPLGPQGPRLRPHGLRRPPTLGPD